MPDAFHVVYLKSVKDKTKTEFLRFRALGLEHSFTVAAEKIDHQLRNNPRDFGDPCFSMRNSPFEVFVRAVRPLLVYYAVHHTDPIVIVSRLEIIEEKA